MLTPRSANMDVIVDAELGERFRGIREPLELHNGSGQTFGYFHPTVIPQAVERPRLRSPLSEDELARRVSTPAVARWPRYGGTSGLNEVYGRLVTRC
jgi:hypothetical protein